MACVLTPRSLMAALLLAALPTAAMEVEAPAQTRQALLQSTVRIRYEREANGSTITGHGTAFGADLSRYGFVGRRYLLTAAHNVLDDSKRPYDTLKVEIQEGTRTYWSRCKAVAWDENLDLCLVEAGDDMPGLLTLAESDPRVGSRLIMAGSPRGVPVKLFAGTLDQRFERGTVRSSATVPFDHGDSGGPMVDAANGKVVGVAVAGVPKDGDLDHNIGLFVPAVGVASFLDTSRRGAPVASPVRTEPIVAASLPRPSQPMAESVPVTPQTPNTAPAVQFHEPGAAAAAETRGPKPEQATVVKASVPAPTPLPVSPATAPEPKPVMAQKPATEQTAIQAGALVTFPAPEAPRRCSVYIVQKGDSLTKIARQRNVAISDLATANGLKDPNLLLVGMKLVVPAVLPVRQEARP